MSKSLFVVLVSLALLVAPALALEQGEYLKGVSYDEIMKMTFSERLSRGLLEIPLFSIGAGVRCVTDSQGWTHCGVKSIDAKGLATQGRTVEQWCEDRCYNSVRVSTPTQAAPPAVTIPPSVVERSCIGGLSIFGFCVSYLFIGISVALLLVTGLMISKSLANNKKRKRKRR